jgi:hypothetical protein
LFPWRILPIWAPSRHGLKIAQTNFSVKKFFSRISCILLHLAPFYLTFPRTVTRFLYDDKPGTSRRPFFFYPFSKTIRASTATALSR